MSHPSPQSAVDSANGSKRSYHPASPELATPNPRKVPKISRACDLCKEKKARCTGTIPCDRCVQRDLPCVYDTKYARGRPPTPRPGSGRGQLPTSTTPGDSRAGSSSTANTAQPIEQISTAHTSISDTLEHTHNGDALSVHAEPITTRGSPELDAAEIGGQYFEPTSGLTFLHRAYKRLATQHTGANINDCNGAENSQPLMSTGDKPFLSQATGVSLPPDATELLRFYFDVCVVTYRIFHRQSVEAWLRAAVQDVADGRPITHTVGNAKAAILLTIFAITTHRQDKIKSSMADLHVEDSSVRRSDSYLSAASALTQAETGLPRLESAQARLVQTIYLTQTSRMSLAWYVFGMAVQIISVMGLHRKPGKKRSPHTRGNQPDYVHVQCRRRTFWVAYTIDVYLSVVFGRPRYLNDDNIDQEFPDSTNDEDMSSHGPAPVGTDAQFDSHIDAVICHARLARIIADVSREVYTIRPTAKSERLARAQDFGEQLHRWRSDLPAHLGTIRPSSLIPTFRRQAMALRLAYCHAIMHANRPFLLGNQSQESAAKDSQSECLSAAKTVLQSIDSMVGDESLFHAFWWSHYVTFCAMAVVFVREIQQCTRGSESSQTDQELFALAERCHSHLAKATFADSPSRRYTVILEELRLEARHQSAKNTPADQSNRLDLPDMMHGDYLQSFVSNSHTEESVGQTAYNLTTDGTQAYGPYQLLEEWKTTDWLDLDASAFGPFGESDLQADMWPINEG